MADNIPHNFFKHLLRKGKVFAERIRNNTSALSESHRNKDLGACGETHAAAFLRQQGYRIIERNFHCHFGEIDIIAGDGDVLVFVEVKTRSSLLFGEPEEAVNAQKMQHMKRTAYMYMRRNRLRPENTLYRFDIVSIVVDYNSNRIASIKLLKGSD